ncbi:hypothetical protein M378DRAFT_18409 [Amanita muscaria Koide BX008]|uniref:Uncharacterized protein n=1 Tax=Amanita muscaria (strain Koide BX008) TaxID=946122 RepID=A0A0C2SLX6_AMAMK|nr:hypothetical protein M378DRAFT_18409 [Amanita muscaria Koide BX008]
MSSMTLFPTTSVSKPSVDRQTPRSLRREHAQVWEHWEDGGKIFIKDIKSSTDNLIKGEQLVQLQRVKSDGIVVEFGVDYIVEAEDNKTTKLQPELYGYSPNKMSKFRCAPSSFNSSIDYPGAPKQRRTQLAQQDLTMGSMGGNIRRPGKSGLSFDLIFRRLQGELQKSKDTGAELHNLTMVLGEIHDTLGGSLPQNMPPPPHSLPPIHPPQVQQSQGGEQRPSSSAGVITTHDGPPPDGGPRHPLPLTISPETLLEIEARLQDIQFSLASHVDKIQSLENILAEHDALKQEMCALRDLVKADLFLVAERVNDTSRKPSSNFEDDEDGEEDDAKSVMTVTTRMDNLEHIDQEDEERMEHRDITEEIPEHDIETDKETHRRQEELGKPQTPESTIGIDMHTQGPSSSSCKDLPNPPDTNPVETSEHVSALSEQVKAAVKSALEADQATIQALEKKIESIEALVKDTQKQQTKNEAETSPTEILSEWIKSVQGQWSSLQEDWSEEREWLSRAREEIEAKTREVDAGLEKMASFETNVGSMKEMQASQGQQLSILQALVTGNGIQQQPQESGGNTPWFREDDGGVVLNREAIKNGGFVAPPSSPSWSSDSVRYRRISSDGEEIEGSTSKSQSHSKERGVGGVDDTDAEGEGEGGESDVREGILDRGGSNKGRPGSSRLPYFNAQATFGVLVLSVAAAAVLAWRVKPE